MLLRFSVDFLILSSDLCKSVSLVAVLWLNTALQKRNNHWEMNTFWGYLLYMYFEHFPHLYKKHIES